MSSSHFDFLYFSIEIKPVSRSKFMTSSLTFYGLNQLLVSTVWSLIDTQHSWCYITRSSNSEKKYRTRSIL